MGTRRSTCRLTYRPRSRGGREPGAHRGDNGSHSVQPERAATMSMTAALTCWRRDLRAVRFLLHEPTYPERGGFWVRAAVGPRLSCSVELGGLVDRRDAAAAAAASANMVVVDAGGSRGPRAARGRVPAVVAHAAGRTLRLRFEPESSRRPRWTRVQPGSASWCRCRTIASRHPRQRSRGRRLGCPVRRYDDDVMHGHRGCWSHWGTRRQLHGPWLAGDARGRNPYWEELL